MDSQIHSILLKIQIHKVKLFVRFPCHISFQLTSEKQKVNSFSSYQLLQGQCCPKQTLKIQVLAIKLNASHYQDQKAKLNIIMISSTTKIPAGSVTFNISDISLNKSKKGTASIEKCPDASANLEYTASIQFLQKQTKKNESSIFLKLEQQSHANLKRNRFDLGKESINDFNLKKYSLDRNQLRKSKYESGLHSPRQRQCSPNIPERDSDHFQPANSQHKMNKNSQGERLERQKSKNLQEINKLKSDLFNKKSFENKGSEEYLKKLKEELNNVSSENGLFREKIKLLERRQKELNQKNRDLQEQVERKKQKNTQYEISKLEIKQILSEKDKVIKRYSEEIKRKEEQISDLKIQANTHKKRNQLKENSLKQQLKKLNQKYQQSENERQKVLIDMNKMLEQLEKVEKKNQKQAKDKQKTYLEQKNKLIKKNENLLRDLESKQEIIEENQNKIQDLKLEIKKIGENLYMTEEELSSLKGQCKNLGNSVYRQKDDKKNMLSKMAQLQEIECLYNKLKKKYSELQQKDKKNLKTLQIANKNIKNLEEKINDSNKTIKDYKQQIKSLNLQISYLNHNIDALKKQEQKILEEADQISLNGLISANRVQELKGKLDQLQISHQELEVALQQQIKYQIRSKQQLESQLQEKKYQIEKLQQNYDQLEKKNKELNEDFFNVNKNNIQLEQKYIQYEEKIQSIKSANNLIKDEKDAISLREKQLQEQIRSQSDEIHQMENKMKKIESQLFMSNEKNEHSEKYFNEKILSEEERAKNKDIELIKSMKLISNLQFSIIEKDNNISSLANQNDRMSREIDYLNEQNQNYKSEQLHSLAYIEQYQVCIKKLEQEIFSLKKNIDDQQNQSKRLSAKIVVINKQWQQYKSQTTKAVQNLLHEIGKDYSGQEIRLESFPDQNLSILQVQSIKRRNALLSKYQETKSDQNQQINLLRQELQKHQKNFIEREEALEEALVTEKNKLKGFLTKTTNEKTQLMESIVQLEETIHQLTTECEHLTIQMKEDKLVIEELQSLLNSKSEENQKLVGELKSLAQNHQLLQKENFRLKNQFQERLTNLNQQKNAQTQKLKKQLQQSQKKITNIQKVLSSKLEALQKCYVKINQISYQRDIKEQNIMELNNRYLDLIQDHKDHLQLNKKVQKSNKISEVKIGELQRDVEHLKNKVEEMSMQKKKVEEMVKEQERGKKNIMEELETANKKISDGETLLKEISEKSRINLQKDWQQIKNLKESNINLNSDLQLRVFEIKQLEETIAHLKTSKQETNSDVQEKKKKILSLQLQISQLTNEKLISSQKYKALENEKLSVANEMKILKESLENMGEELLEAEAEANMVGPKNKEIRCLQEEIRAKERKSEEGLMEFKRELINLRKEISLKEEEYQNQIKNLEEDNQKIQKQLKLQKQESEDIEQKKEQQISQLNAEIDNLQTSLSSQSEIINSLNEQVTKLKTLISDKDFHLASSSQNQSDQNRRIHTFQEELKKCKEGWQRDKNQLLPMNKQFNDLQNQVVKYKKYVTQLEGKTKQLIEVGKKRLNEDARSSVGDVLREMQTVLLRTKTNLIKKCQSEKQKEGVMTDFRVMQEKLDSAIRSHNIFSR